MSDNERRLSIYSRSMQVFKVELNGNTVPRVSAVSFSVDAEEHGIEASMTFRVDVADLIEAVSLLPSQAPDTEVAE